MSGHLNDHQLQDYLDGHLDPAVADSARRHLAGCDRCQEKLGRIEALLERVGRLPAELPPPGEAWDSIRRAIEQQRVRPFGRIAEPRRWLLPLAVAAGLAVLAAAGWLLRKSGVPETATPVLPVAAGDIRDYQGLVAQLERELESRRDALPAEVIAMVERNLAVIDSAVAEIVSALADDPENETLRSVLASSYRQKIAVLEHLTETAS